MLNIDSYWERRFRYGGPWPIWIKNIDIIEKLVKDHNLKPVDSEYLVGNTPVYQEINEVKGKMTTIPRPLPFPGGLRYPHLHFKGSLYALNEKAWKEFSGNILKEIRSRIDKVNTISFEQVMEINDAFDSLS